MITERKRRYSLWQVFWIVLAVYLFFFTLGIIAASIVPVAGAEVSLKKLLSRHALFSQSYSIIALTIFYYLISNLFYRYFFEKKGIPDFIKALVLAALMLVAYNAGNYFLTDYQKAADKLTMGVLVFSFVISSMLQLAFALLIPYLTLLRDEKKQRKVLEEQKMQLEVEKSQANLNFLKAQINPHFLHNTLNFLYAKSLPLSPELSEGILTLSDIMRYALSEGNAKDGKAPLKDEIEHVRNVIKIQQLRFDNKLNVQFSVEGVVNGATIVPFVLITLVENAFKHGDLKNTTNPINIRVVVKNGTLYFYCQNKKKTGPKEISTGIGLDNIQKRLELAYGSQYKFMVKDDDEFYTTELFINAI